MDEVTCEKEQRPEGSSRSYVDWQDKPLLYISGPMLSEGHAYINVSRAITAGQYARTLGWSVVIPHLDFAVSMVTGITSAEYFIDNDLNILSRCDAVLVLPYGIEYKDGKQSGTSIELDFAEDTNIPIFTIETLPHAQVFDESVEVA